MELYDRYAGLAYAVAMRVLGDPGRSEDVVQEAFLKIWTNAASFDPKKGSLRTWLITAVRNRSIDYLRGRGAHERQELELQPELIESSLRSDPWHEVSLSLERMAVRAAAPEPRLGVAAHRQRGMGGRTAEEVAHRRADDTPDAG